MNRPCRVCARQMVPNKQRPPAGMVRHHGRGLCSGCHDRAGRDGTLDEHPRINRALVDTLEDYAFLTARGCTRDEVAARLGITRNGLTQALLRGRQAAA